jgi:hypothetical protein
MSTIGPVKAFPVTMTCGATLTSAFDLGGSYGKVMLGIPTNASGSFYVQASDSATGTFRRLYHAADVDTATPTVLVINSSVSNCYVGIPMGAQFGKIEMSTAPSFALGFKVICSTN